MATIQITGRITKDPEINAKEGKNGNYTFTTFSIADGSRGKDKTDFFNCKAYGTTGEFIEKFFRKGGWISVAGIIETWESAEGKKGFTVVVDKAAFCGNKQSDVPF